MSIWKAAAYAVTGLAATAALVSYGYNNTDALSYAVSGIAKYWKAAALIAVASIAVWEGKGILSSIGSSTSAGTTAVARNAPEFLSSTGIALGAAVGLYALNKVGLFNGWVIPMTLAAGGAILLSSAIHKHRVAVAHAASTGTPTPHWLDSSLTRKGVFAVSAALITGLVTHHLLSKYAPSLPADFRDGVSVLMALGIGLTASHNRRWSLGGKLAVAALGVFAVFAIANQDATMNAMSTAANWFGWGQNSVPYCNKFLSKTPCNMTTEVRNGQMMHYALSGSNQWQNMGKDQQIQILNVDPNRPDLATAIYGPLTVLVSVREIKLALTN